MSEKKSWADIVRETINKEPRLTKKLSRYIIEFPYKKLVLLTSSVGTVHGLTYAINYPQDVNALVLAALPIGFPNGFCIPVENLSAPAPAASGFSRKT